MSGCDWCLGNELLHRYHDAEWGVPLFDDRRHFEYLSMETLQCGLSWNTVLKKREIFRACFDGFDPARVAAYTEADAARILGFEGMLRSRRKIDAVIHNARCFLAVCAEAGSFSSWLWACCGGSPIVYDGHPEGKTPAANGLSDRVAAELKKRGFKFIGSVTVYAYLQSCGVINDHAADCPCFARLCAARPYARLPRDAER